MSQNNPAGTAPAPATAPAATYQRLNQRQFTLRREICHEYCINPDDVIFDGENDDPFLAFDAASIMVLVLAPELIDISISKEYADEEGINFTSYCRIVRNDGIVREMSGHSFKGEVMFDRTPINDSNQAYAVSQARAFRKTLRAIGFDPIRAHRARMAARSTPNGGPPFLGGAAGAIASPTTMNRIGDAGRNIINSPTCPGCECAWGDCRCNDQVPAAPAEIAADLQRLETESPAYVGGPATAPLTDHQIRANSVAEVHALGNELGLIQGNDKSAWERSLGLWFNGRTSTVDLSQEELDRLAVILRDLKRGMKAFQDGKRANHPLTKVQ